MDWKFLVLKPVSLSLIMIWFRKKYKYSLSWLFKQVNVWACLLLFKLFLHKLLFTCLKLSNLTSCMSANHRPSDYWENRVFILFAPLFEAVEVSLCIVLIFLIWWHQVTIIMIHTKTQSYIIKCILIQFQISVSPFFSSKTAFVFPPPN